MLVTVLWVRSYGTDDVVGGNLWNGHSVIVESIPARVDIELWDGKTGWHAASSSWADLIAQGIEPPPLDGNGYSHRKYLHYSSTVIPYWLPLVVSVALSWCVWGPPLRRQLSLRTLLITTTLVAGAPGLIVWATRN